MVGDLQSPTKILSAFSLYVLHHTPNPVITGYNPAEYKPGLQIPTYQIPYTSFLVPFFLLIGNGIPEGASWITVARLTGIVC